MKSKYLKIAIHIFAWACLLLSPMVFLPKPDNTFPRPDDAMVFRFLFSNIFLIVFYYVNFLVFIPRLLLKRKIIFYLLFVISCLFIYTEIPRLVFSVASPPGFPSHMRHDWHGDPVGLVMFLSILLVSSGIRLVTEWQKVEKRAQFIEKEKVETELSFLKSQINPHFLFNTLNTIYNLALKRSELTADAVFKLSQMMRYVLNDATQEYVPLEKELEYISHYIELQKMRLTQKVSIDFRNECEYSGLKIAPMILIPFIENAFKYGISTHENSTLRIHLKTIAKKLFVYIENPIFSRTESLLDSSGIGIKNTQQRLLLMYPGNYELEIAQKNNIYFVDLKLTL